VELKVLNTVMIFIILLEIMDKNVFQIAIVALESVYKDNAMEINLIIQNVISIKTVKA
jgi:hypothetical protein